MEEDNRKTFAELFRWLIESELPPVEKFHKILEKILNQTNTKQ